MEWVRGGFRVWGDKESEEIPLEKVVHVGLGVS